MSGEVLYRRSATGKVVHRSTCTRAGKASVEWNYARDKLGNNHQLVLAEIDAVSWLRGCSHCMAPVDPTPVTPERLYDLWMGPNAMGLIVDQQEKVRIVTMRDGRQYSAPYAGESS